MTNKLNKLIIGFSALLLILVIIPSGFASDDIDLNVTEPVALEFDYDSNILEAGSADYYFNSSTEKDGTGTIDNPYKTLTANRIKSNSNIHLANGEYTLDKRKDISNVNFIGSDPEKTIIKYNGVGFNVQTSINLQNLTLYNLTINNNYRVTATNTIFAEGCGVVEDSYGNNFGGAIYTPYNVYYTTSVDVKNCTFINNHAEYGGAIYMETGYLYVTDCIFSNNYAYNYGGAIGLEYDSRATITDTKFINSSSKNDAGGAVYLRDSYISGSNIEFDNCTATFGGGIAALSSTVNLKSAKGENNNAKWDGGAIYQMYGTISITSSSFNNNSAHNGGAVFVDNSTSLTLTKTIFTNNKASFAAGAIYSLLNKLNQGNSVKDISLENIFINNTAILQNDEYEVDTVDLRIGNSNYTMYAINETIINSLPSYYSLIDDGYVTAVKDQQTSGNCWAFTAIATLESCILKASGDNLDLSEEHMKNIIELYSDYGWSIDTNNGGYNAMPFGYYASWLGPVFEVDDLTDDRSALSPILNSIMHVQNIAFLKRDSYTDNNAIKEALIKYGAVGTGIYYDDSYRYGNSYYFYGTTYANHAVTIVGWDDNYSRNNFYSTPQGNGAWIVKNSWGSEWGKDGYFYVSYYDTVFATVGDSEGSYTFILNDTIRFDKNYQYDIAGRTDYFYNSSSEVWYKNVFTATDNEFIAAASTYFEKATNWDLSIYVNNVLKTTKTGFSNAGYYTINLDNIIPVRIGDTFEVVFKIVVDSEAAFPISEKILLNKQVYSEGCSFVSYDGETWKDLCNLKWSYSSHTYSSQVACIKAFTISNSVDTNLTLNISYDGYNPVNITATVIDSYGNLVNMGNVTFKFNEKEFVINVTDGIAQITYSFDKIINNITAVYESDNYYTSNSSATVEINVLDVELNADIVKDLNKVVINITANQKITDTVSVVINDKKYNVTLVDGQGNLTLEEVDIGNYDVKVSLENNEIYNSEEQEDTFTVDVITTKIISDNLTTDDNSGEGFTVVLTNKTGEGIANKNITFNLDGKNYTAVTDNDGKASIPIYLDNNGEYEITTTFTGDEDYVAFATTNTIKVKAKVNISLDIVQTVNNVVVNIQLNRSINDTVSLRVNENNYTVNVANGKGTLKLNNLDNNEYKVIVTLDNVDEYISNETSADFNININELRIISSDMTTSDFSGAEYAITLIDMNNTPVTNKEVIITLNGEMYIVKTDEYGIAYINVNLKAGTYKISTKYEGDNEYFTATAINNIIVKNKIDISISVSKNSNNALVTIKLSKSIDESLNVVINNRNYFINSVNGRELINLNNLDNGNYDISAMLVNTEDYISEIANKSFVMNVNDLKIVSNNMETLDLSCDLYSVTLLDNNNNPIANRTLLFTVDSTNYIKTTDENGVASVAINLNPGTYEIKTIFNGDDDFFKNNSSNTITVKDGYLLKDMSINSKTNDVIVEVTLTKEVSDIVEIDINGTKYYVTTVDGKGILNINLDNGNYDITAKLNKFNSTKTVSFTVDTPNEIKSNDFITYYQSGSEYVITLLNNNKTVSGQTVTFILNGETYNRTTDENGTASINVDLNVGTYTVSIANPESITKTQTIKVIETITGNKDVIKYYKGSEVYKVRVMGDNNKPVGAGETVVIKINKKSYNVKTDKNGYVSFKISLKPKKYTITATYKKYTVTNKVTVKSTIITKNLSKKKSKTAKFSAKLVNTKGKVLKNKKITFKFKGVTYKVKTNSKGIAKLTINKNLKVGKHTIYTSYGSLKIKNTITVKK